jgi:hypothetical protein
MISVTEIPVCNICGAPIDEQEELCTLCYDTLDEGNGVCYDDDGYGPCTESDETPLVAGVVQ